MIKNGLVMTVRKHYAIVLTPSNAYEKIIKRHQMEVGTTIMYTSEDIINESGLWRDMAMSKKYISIASIAVILLFVGIFGTRFIGSHDNNIIRESIDINENPLVSTIVTVDINPSFKLELDESQVVIGYEALNDDANKVNLDGIMGLQVEDAIELIVSQAESAGFINIEDLTEDYVLISIVNLSENDSEMMQGVFNKLEEKSATSKTLQAVNLALIEASQEQLDEALQMEVPLGLLASGNKEETSVKSFFADQNQVDQFMEKGNMIQQSLEYEFRLMEKYLNEIADGEALKIQLQSAFEISKEEFYHARELYEKAREAYELAVASGIQEDIDAAKLMLEEANQLKLMMEQYEDQINEVKSVLRRSMDGEDKILLEKVAEEIRTRAEMENQFEERSEEGNQNREEEQLENQSDEDRNREEEQNRINEQNEDEEKLRDQEQNRQEEHNQENLQGDEQAENEDSTDEEIISDDQTGQNQEGSDDKDTSDDESEGEHQGENAEKRGDGQTDSGRDNSDIED